MPSLQLPFRHDRLTDPPRTTVVDAVGRWVATFTDGAHSVAVRGRFRTFREPGTRATVRHDVWVRLLPAPFAGTVDGSWLQTALASQADDVLAVAMQYVALAPSRFDQSGLRVAGDAEYGPLLPGGGGRAEGSDFNDYLGVAWPYPAGVDEAEVDQLGCLDCSGFVRMVFGYRLGVPLGQRGSRSALPRRAKMQYQKAPGVILIRNDGVQATAYGRLQPGDLVFFDADAGDGTAIDHVGIYLGRDTAGNERFVSSRKAANGPTMGNRRGSSTLNPSDASALYARAFRAARRL